MFSFAPGVFRILPSTFMILNCRKFLSVLYVVFFTRSPVLCFLPSSFVIIDWKVLLSTFYILLFTTKLALGILFSTSFNFSSKMDYFITSFVSSSYVLIELLAFGFLFSTFCSLFTYVLHVCKVSSPNNISQNWFFFFFFFFFFFLKF